MKIKQLLGSLMAMATLTTCAFAAVGCSENSAQGAPVEQTQTGGMVISEGKSNGVSLMATTISAEDYDEYGVAATAESAFQITATVKNNDGSIATGAKIDWSVAFEVEGQDVTQITVTPTSDGAWTANVACFEGYSVPIIITASLRDDASIKATCKCEYVQKIAGVYLQLDGEDIEGNTVYYVSGGSSRDYQLALANVTSSYTLYSNYTKKIQICFEENIISALTAQGFTCSNYATQYTELCYTSNFAGNAINLIRGPGEYDYDTYGEFCDVDEFEAGDYNEKIKVALGTLGVGTKIATIKVTIDFNGYDAKYEGMFEDLTYYYDVVITESFYAAPAEPASIELSDSELYF